MELMEGRHGTPLAIPAIRQDGLGTTRVTISKSMTDADLQRRFKQMASTDHSFGQDGYDLHRCQMCKGDGQIAKSKTETIVCPKCGGSGLS
jgi:DnaJ-class molecular chaperone